MPVQPDVSICLVAEPDAGLLAPPLRAVAAMGKEMEAEAVVVAPPEAVAILDRLEREFPWVKWVETRAGSRAFLRNQAMEVATGRYLAFWEPRWEISETDARQLVDFLDDNPDTGLAAPALLESSGRMRPSARAFPGLGAALALALGLAPAQAGALGRPIPVPGGSAKPLAVDWLEGEVLYVRRETLEEVGGFRESFTRYEDMEICLRARAAGWHIHFLGAVRTDAAGNTERREHGGAVPGRDLASALFLFLLRKRFGRRTLGLARR